MATRAGLNTKGNNGSVSGGASSAPPPPAKKHWVAPQGVRLTAHMAEEDASARQAELFYLQKQIQSQTPMVIVLEDGEKIEGCIEWYDRQSLKVRGNVRTLVYKPAIKYMYKLGEAE
jgi:sRNA-binding regulator protein Hfq